MTYTTFIEPAATANSNQPNQFEHLMNQMGVRVSFARDEEIYVQEEKADLIYRVVRGTVRTTRLMSDGRRQVGDFYYEGEIFGVEAGDEHLFSAEALSDCLIQAIKLSALRDSTDGHLERLMGRAANRELLRAHEHVLLLGRKNACERVATFLMSAAGRCKSERVELPMGRQDMADYLGLTIETVSRMLTQLQASALVEFGGLRDFRVKNQTAMARLAA